MKRKLIWLPAFLIGCVALSTLLLNRASGSRSHNYVQQISLPVPEVNQVTDVTSTEAKKIQLALLLDTSNSMDGLIDQAKQQLWNIVNELARASKDSVSANIEIALYEYGNDWLSVSSGYIRQVTAFSSDLDNLSAKLFELKTNGGSEYCGQVIRDAVNGLKWSTNDSCYKVIYIAGNEPFNQGSVSFKESCEIAHSKGINVNTIFCGQYAGGLATNWSKGAEIGGGIYLNIDSDQRTVQVATPYDAQILQLNQQLNQTYIYYGKEGETKKANQESQDANAGKYSAANTAKRAISKSSKIYSNESWDLVDAYEKDSAVIAKVDKSTLPEKYRNQTTTQLKETVKAENEKRSELKKEISHLGVERQNYITNQTSSDSSNNNTLGVKMINTIHEQAGKKGFVFKEG
ncbi:MAG: hypothetical protein GC181_15685 [Bacteroidetes bacterium]|nr:hypothetical protein [Bacteroidota bacterium]